MLDFPSEKIPEVQFGGSASRRMINPIHRAVMWNREKFLIAKLTVHTYIYDISYLMSRDIFAVVVGAR